MIVNMVKEYEERLRVKMLDKDGNIFAYMIGIVEYIANEVSLPASARVERIKALTTAYENIRRRA